MEGIIYNLPSAYYSHLTLIKPPQAAKDERCTQYWLMNTIMKAIHKQYKCYLAHVQVK